MFSNIKSAQIAPFPENDPHTELKVIAKCCYFAAWPKLSTPEDRYSMASESCDHPKPHITPLTS